MKKLKNILEKNGISLVFFCIIILFGVSGWILKDQKNSTSENRPLQQLPAFSTKAVLDGDWSTQMETYLSDQFPLRSSWVKIHTNLEVELGKKKFSDVYIGKEDTLFQESVVPSSTLIKEKQDAINAFSTNHSSLTISMLLVPNKATILKDKLPNHIESQDQQKTIDTFGKGLQESIKFTNPYETLIKHKNEELYYRSDHHWTGRGAYLAFASWKEQMMSEDPLLQYQAYRVNNSFYGTLANSSGYFRGKGDQVDIYTSKDDPLYTVKYVDSKQASASLFDMKKAASSNPYEVFLSGNHPLIEISTTAENARHLLLLKDSYANCFVSYILPYYSKITVVDPRYYYEDLNQLITDNEISDVLLLYNANTFFSDSSLQNVITQTK